MNSNSISAVKSNDEFVKPKRKSVKKPSSNFKYSEYSRQLDHEYDYKLKGILKNSQNSSESCKENN